ncbi:MAG: hypothetical protein PHE79_08680 [Eubacteriales bacterium]|nr:hypothetical protein [Eubacteriales bacterium]
MAGWIKLYRKITENPLWEDRPFSKGQAWIDLIIMANRLPTKLIYGNTIIDLERGQLHTSEPKLMERWGWSKKKVRAYLVLLERLKMATAKGTTKGTTITIENYSVYQDIGTAQDTDEDTFQEPQRDRKGTAQGKQTRSKEEKEGKEDKNIIPPYPLTEFCFSSALENKIMEWLKYKTEINDSYKPTGFKTLLGIIKKNSDKYGEQAVINLINESMSSNWHGIIWDRIKPTERNGSATTHSWRFSDIDMGGSE